MGPGVLVSHLENKLSEVALKVAVVTLFPDMVKGVLDYSIPARAAKQGLFALSVHDPREHTHDKHRTVDDKPYGGGPGMLMKVQPLRDAIGEAKQSAGSDAYVVYLSPQGKRLEQQDVERLSAKRKLVMVAGRYEGIDERVIESDIDEEVSIGDYVLSGGELAAAVLIDAMVRTLPGALGDADSAEQDSFKNGLLDHPHYTRPEEIGGQAVPEVLLSGDHAAIQRWRLKQALGRTWLRRPDLLEQVELNSEQRELLDEFKREY
jgi:tRNA (guanine37-N1)-methyltransferase